MQWITIVFYWFSESLGLNKSTFSIPTRTFSTFESEIDFYIDFSLKKWTQGFQNESKIAQNGSRSREVHWVNRSFRSKVRPEGPGRPQGFKNQPQGSKSEPHFAPEDPKHCHVFVDFWNAALRISNFGLQALFFDLRPSNFDLRASTFALRGSSLQFRPSSFEVRASSLYLRPSNFKFRSSSFEGLAECA